MRCVIACAALAGCIATSTTTPLSRIANAAPTLQREGTAVVAVEEDDPSKGSLAFTTEVVRLDEAIGVRLAGQSTEKRMKIRELFADCPPDFDRDNTEANRRTYPRCRLFGAGDVRLHGGHRADKAKIMLAGALVAAAGDLVCIAECGEHASKTAIDVGVISASVVGIGWWLYEITKDSSLKR